MNSYINVYGHKQVKYSKQGKRFLTQLDMAEAKRTDSIRNSEIKRGEREKLPHRYICDCGCGTEGCMMVNESQY